MSIYDKASLVLIPSGTKTSKVYSQKPVSGDGDFTFTRSSAATRVNADGNIEKETQNLLLQSNSFDTTWTQSNISTLTSGQSGYDGTSDAWLVEKSASSNGYLRQNISLSGVHTFSLYAKSNSLNGVLIQTRGASTKSAQFDLSTGTLGTAANNIDAKIENIGSGWYRCSVSVNDSAITQVRVFICDDGTTIGTTAGSIYIQDAQLEYGLVARDVITTTTTAVEGGITDNVPRLDYTDSSCPALLLEPQRTNLFTYSEYIEGWSTSNTGITLEENAVTSPEGVVNAAKIKEDANNAAHAVRQLTGPTLTSGTDYTFSFFAKKGERSIVAISNTIGASNDKNCFFDLENGEVLTNQFDSASIEDFGNGWFRCIATDTADANDDYDTRIYTATADNQFSHQGVLGSGLYIFGLQLEAGSYATSYIPTYGSSVTRNVESAVKTLGASYFPTNGISVFVDFDVTYSSVTNFADLYQLAGSSAQLRLETRTNGRIYIQQGNMVTSGDNFNAYNLCPSTAKKICLTFSSTQVKAYVDGVLINTWNGSYTWDFTDLNMAMQTSTAAYNNTMLFPSTLSNQEAIDLTTL